MLELNSHKNVEDGQKGVGNKVSNKPISSRCRIIQHPPFFPQSFTIKIDTCAISNENTILYLFVGFTIRGS